MSSSASSSSQDASSFLREATFERPDNSLSAPGDAVTATDLLLGSYDPTRLHPLAGLSDTLEYLQLEDERTSDLPGGETAMPSRGWSDDLSYGTGTMYLSGKCSCTAREVGLRLRCPPTSRCCRLLTSRC
jgi:import inner membrane translocase subunit TIM23